MEIESADLVLRNGLTTEAEIIVIDDDDEEEERIKYSIVGETKNSNVCLKNGETNSTVESDAESSSSSVDKWTKRNINVNKCDSVCCDKENNECQEVNYFESSKNFVSRASRPQCMGCLRSFNTMNEYYCHKLISCVSDHSDILQNARPQTKTYFCEVCPLIFSTKYQLRSHSRYYCNTKTFFCPICHNHFSSNEHLLKHKLFTSCVQQLFVCPACLCRFKKLQSLKKHFKKMICKGVSTRSKNDLYKNELTGRFTCPICVEIFSSETEMRAHAWNHIPPVTKSSVFEQCPLCAKRFSTEDASEYHKFFACKKKLYRCEFCLQRFVSRGRVINHHRFNCIGIKETKDCTAVETYYVPDSETTFSKIKLKKLRNLSNRCRMCLKHFDTEQELKKHIRFYCLSMPYCCHVCKRRFTCNSGLAVHKVKHSEMSKTVSIDEIDLSL